MRRIVGVIIAIAGLLSACGTATIKPEGAAQSVVDVVSRQTGFHPSDVRCPSDVEAKVGKTFSCSFTGPEGKYTADMRVTKVQGSRVVFDVQTRRT